MLVRDCRSLMPMNAFRYATRDSVTDSSLSLLVRGGGNKSPVITFCGVQNLPYQPAQGLAWLGVTRPSLQLLLVSCIPIVSLPRQEAGEASRQSCVVAVLVSSVHRWPVSTNLPESLLLLVSSDLPVLVCRAMLIRPLEHLCPYNAARGICDWWHRAVQQTVVRRARGP